jgi:hypothetical protein
VVRVEVRHAYPNCTRYIHRLTQTEPSPYVPRAGRTPPEAGWKRAEWAHDVLPRDDPPAREPQG